MLLLYAIIGVAALYLLGLLFKIPIKILMKLVKNGIIGIVFLLIANFIASMFDITAIEITPLNAILTGFLGLPWIIILFFIQ
ncbi:MAG: pro-sigmaK processing inhibitor BofA family protein [Tissierellia bacterium]|nr:pro-sigmaK processing inhibitor BofA family protein [Tissierellia bacterium]